jgi:hypothetical protein
MVVVAVDAAVVGEFASACSVVVLVGLSEQALARMIPEKIITERNEAMVSPDGFNWFINEKL